MMKDNIEDNVECGLAKADDAHLFFFRLQLDAHGMQLVVAVGRMGK